ncbi:hypothetical protein JCM10213v2_005902 [Rhodosporidiobolus nylandii]
MTAFLPLRRCRLLSVPPTLRRRFIVGPYHPSLDDCPPSPSLRRLLEWERAAPVGGWRSVQLWERVKCEDFDEDHNGVYHYQVELWVQDAAVEEENPLKGEVQTHGESTDEVEALEEAAKSILWVIERSKQDSDAACRLATSP